MFLGKGEKKSWFLKCSPFSSIFSKYLSLKYFFSKTRDFCVVKPKPLPVNESSDSSIVKYTAQKIKGSHERTNITQISKFIFFFFISLNTPQSSTSILTREFGSILSLFD